ncbi:MAG: FKBP-type peptidyl-prolyl cis-trans isomerase [Chitinophagaceae bacterium]
MKKNLLAVFLVFILFTENSCLKDKSCQPKTIQSEEGALQNMITTFGLNATRHSSGLYYEIINQGSGAAPNPASSVSVRYVGKLADGTIFDQATSPTSLFPMANFIAGWQIGLSLIRESGFIKLVIPSSLAYGCQQAGIIPAHSILYFEVELVDVQ